MSQENKRIRLTEKDKEEIGLKCCNCHSVQNLEYHHIIPFILGGSDINSNMCCLCRNCHTALHNSDYSYFKKVKLVRPDRTIGRPKTSYKDIPYELREDLKNKNYNTITALANKYGISRRSIYKYKNIIEESDNV